MRPIRPEAGTEDAVVRAAGCVLWRHGPDGGVELALVHRPKYLDWSFPKGKLKRGEDAWVGALREVREETGMDCVLGPVLPTSRYPVADGRLKEVRYWAARSAGGTFAPNREVDRLAWLPADEARAHLTHERDRGLVDALLRVLGE
ncbi:NUDIX hydrolase [Streptomyces huiliensis]|uniref:NUDIX hydrolase n=1 Tax=Streptomyces huiliensis TaxID=2876027 RepID=UPI001CBC6B95|nr:NUDIX hydrolase [Streptomyces huiliensis]MBZ4323751.1 NUDIX hydrolase [Streptomyces huiliensis]